MHDPKAQPLPPADASAAPGEWVDIRFTVEPSYAGWRLEDYLQEKLKRLPHARVRRMIRTAVHSEEEARGLRLKAETPVWPGLSFVVRRRFEEEPETPELAEGELFLDDWLLVLDKPAGLPIHPTARYHRGTLVSKVHARYGAGFAEPAHRLDRETSGLVVCGRTPEACRRLMQTFVSGRVEKEYLALCEGHPPSDAFLVDAPIAEGGEVVRIAVRIDPVEGRPARTRFEVLRRFTRGGAPFALLRCLPETGRQHQIRIHLHTAGFPLVGDKMYGPDPRYFDRFSRRCLEPEAWERLRLPRHALHAAGLRLPHPATGEVLTFRAPLPDDLQAFLDGAD
jgi:23S rRNA pseudouridine1911/1915/1917 synthase